MTRTPCPPAESPAQRTRDAHARLRAHQRARLRANKGSVAYACYVVVFVAVLTVPPVVSTLLAALREPPDLPSLPGSPLDSLPFLLTAALLMLGWSTLQDARIRGAIRADLPLIDWFLALPIDGGSVLAPALWRSAAARCLAGAALGPLLLLGMCQVLLPPPDAAPGLVLASVAVAGAASGALTAFAGVLVMADSGRLLARIRPFYYGALCLLVAAGGTAASAPTPALLADAVLWSGPWGWAAQPFLTPNTGSPLAAGVSLGLLALLLLPSGVLAFRRLEALPLAGLRERASVAAGLRSGVWISDTSWLHTALGEHTPARMLRRLRLAAPRHPWQSVPWRDALGLLRTPIRLVRAALLAAVALLLFGAADSVPPADTLGIALRIAPPTLLYLAVGQLLGTVRHEVADPRRTRLFTCTPGRLALWHAVVPIVVMAAIVGAASAIVLAQGAASGAAVQPLLLVPLAVAAALAGAYRGTLPDYLNIGYESPLGNSAPLQILLWHASGLVALLALAWPVMTSGLSGPLQQGAWSAAGTCAVLWWAQRRARAATGMAA